MSKTRLITDNQTQYNYQYMTLEISIEILNIYLKENDDVGDNKRQYAQKIRRAHCV